MKSKILVFIFSILASLHTSAETITFGIVPQQSAATLVKNWDPILQYLSEQVGHNIELRTAKDIPEFEKRVSAGEYDIAYMNPYQYARFHQDPGYIAFAKQKDKKIRGIVVVHKDFPITDIQQLNGKTLAFPSPVAFGAAALPIFTLAQQNIHVQPRYVSSHESVYLNVAQGFFAAGGGVERTFNNSAPEIRERLRVLWKTPEYSPHAFAFRSDLNAELAKEVQAAFLAMNDDQRGVELLKNIGFNGISQAQDSDWDDVRQLQLTMLNHMLKKQMGQ
ncbi:phosphate/phosphite/phosphonate ABC transporter substrate-binding protein [Microbulbifer aggregans]|uniref:phosphate/phosphite/phosphonate ABC transporter substrate-binding protein n=1 Tax=Microbulbifer aggregans TaxID=1769779 RepID=UPI001CFE4E6D|nr:phosphate/phosphite/phosphonate ABC transporter substrate-binding protein [Microbulbifer aggregans]